MNLSEHAARRARERGIPPLIVDWLGRYGAEVRKHGASKFYFDKAARRRLARDVGDRVVDQLGPLLDSYIVVGDDTVITVAHRLHRIRRR